MRGIEFKNPPCQPRRSRSIALFDHYYSEQEGGGIAGYEDKQIGCIAEAVIPGRDRVHHLVRNVVEKDRPICQAAKQVQSEVPPWQGKRGANPHGTPLIAATSSLAMRVRRPAGVPRDDQTQCAPREVS